MYNVEKYFEPETLQETLQLLERYPQAYIIAGGTDVLIKMHSGKIEKADLISIRKLRSLEKIELKKDGTITIGPLATFTQIASSHLLIEKIPILTEAASSMGGPQIRNVATIGGNICNGATSADSAPTLFALQAKLVLLSQNGQRVVPIEKFYFGPGKVDLQPGEILTKIQLEPSSYQGFGGNYIKFSVRKAMDLAILGVAAICKVTKDNAFEEVKIALGVAGPTPLRCFEAEDYAKGQKISLEVLEQIGKLAVQSTNARTSWRASKEYREHLVEELTKRALNKAIQNAGGEGIDY